ncbi:MAG TPA: shikimate kinase [Candidatus Polarisedimenticolia bacterium]|nr:shikimate kinase [Candidatus Polarisedimenticolia bacterium]
MTQPPADQIYLVGFMGAGKTTVGNDLAARLGWEFADLDEVLSRREGKGLQEIFRDSGEPHFRRVEREVLASLTAIPRLVVATGGGTYVAEENRRLVEAAGWSVWLEVSLQEALRRCAGGVGRPLWGGRTEMESLYRYRQEFYRCARVHVNTEGALPALVARETLESLHAEGFTRE